MEAHRVQTRHPLRGEQAFVVVEEPDDETVKEPRLEGIASSVVNSSAASVHCNELLLPDDQKRNDINANLMITVKCTEIQRRVKAIQVHLKDIKKMLADYTCIAHDDRVLKGAFLQLEYLLEYLNKSLEAPPVNWKHIKSLSLKDKGLSRILRRYHVLKVEFSANVLEDAIIALGDIIRAFRKYFLRFQLSVNVVLNLSTCGRGMFKSQCSESGVKYDKSRLDSKI